MKEKASSSRTLKRVIQNLEGQKHLVVLSFLLALVSVAGTLFVPILVGRAIDEIVGTGRLRRARDERCADCRDGGRCGA